MPDRRRAARARSAGRRTGRRSPARRRRPVRRAGRAHRRATDAARRPGRAGRRRPIAIAAARPGWRFGSSVSGCVGRPRRSRGGARAARSTPLASSRSYGRAPGDPRPGSRRRRSGRARAATTRGCARPSSRAVALADLEHRDVVAALADGSPATTSRRLPRTLWRMTECWLESGLVDRDRHGRRGSPSPGTSGSSTGPNRSTIAGDTRAGVTASVTPAPPASRERRRGGRAVEGR